MITDGSFELWQASGLGEYKRHWPFGFASWGCWDEAWSVPTSGGIAQARRRLGSQPLAEVFSRVAVPVADLLTRGAFLGSWRLMAIDGFEWDVPDTKANAAVFGYAGSGGNRSAFPKARVVTHQ